MKINYSIFFTIFVIHLFTLAHLVHADENLLIVNEHPNTKITVYLQVEKEKNKEEETIIEIFAKESRNITISDKTLGIIILVNTKGNQYIKSVDLPLRNNENTLIIKKDNNSNFIQKKLMRFIKTSKKEKLTKWFKWAKNKINIKSDE